VKIVNKREAIRSRLTPTITHNTAADTDAYLDTDTDIYRNLGRQILRLDINLSTSLGLYLNLTEQIPPEICWAGKL